nr:hypothetical protein [Candidatus Neomarinimicrobiota bacterium]
MGRDPLESIISIHDLKQAEWFTTDEAGITNLKRKTRKNAREFLYLRKGEDFGAFIQMLYELYSQQPEQIQITYDLYFNQFATILECISIKRILEYDWE